MRWNLFAYVRVCAFVHKCVHAHEQACACMGVACALVVDKDVHLCGAEADTYCDKGADTTVQGRFTLADQRGKPMYGEAAILQIKNIQTCEANLVLSEPPAQSSWQLSPGEGWLHMPRDTHRQYGFCCPVRACLG